MGNRLYLPVGAKPSPFPTDEREELMNRLYAAQYWVPGAKDLEVAHLRDLVAFAEERFKQDEEKRILEGQKIVSQMDAKQVQGAIKEYLNWRNHKRGIKFKYENK